MNKYCDNCGKEVHTRIIEKEEEYVVCNEKITVTAQVRICDECGEEFFDEELDNATLVRAFNIYRKRHKLLMPDEIKKIREQYGLSQRGLSKLLNWGDKTIHRYENGSLQDKAHNCTLLFLREPENMKCYMADNELNLDQTQREKLEQKVEELINDPNKTKLGRRLLDVYLKEKPSVNNGFKTFDFEKFYAVILYFTNQNVNLLKVKLLKLLNYADMIYYQENGISLTGTRYKHLPFGPVPDNYDILFGIMEAGNIIRVDIQFENGYENHRIIPTRDDYKKLLTCDELKILKKVNDKFVDYNSSEISMYSHHETGYKETRPGEIIPYTFAKEISF